MSRVFLSIDMDAFYCGVEQRLNPALKGEPFVVKQKQIAATVSYPARKLGVGKLDNIASILERFPQVQVVDGEDLSKYRAAGLEIFRWLQRSFVVERLGLEEFRFEVTEQLNDALKPLRRLFRSRQVPDLDGIRFECEGTVECPNFFFDFDGITFPEGQNTFDSQIEPLQYLAGHYAAHLRDKILAELGFDCSIGVATSKHIAKMACSRNKPAGITVVLPGSEREFVQGAAINSIPGLGHKMQLWLLTEYGLERNETVEKLHKVVPNNAFTAQFGQEIWDLTCGIDKSEIVPWKGPAQISKEDTFSPFIEANRCYPHIQRLVAALLVQAQEEIVVDNQWVVVPLKFRVASSRHNIHSMGRKTKQIPLRLKSQVEMKELEKMLVGHAYAMLNDIMKEPLRVLNVALVMS